MEYEAVIGLEIHVELKTNSKLFCGCPVTFGSAPNTQVCPVCLGLPGALPVLNKKTVEYIIMTGLALNCRISSYSKFDRKNYFYPDLPKAFQISQYDKPLAENGYIDIEPAQGVKKRIRIRRAHLEEDAGKLIHSPSGKESYVDYNRSGVPLIEIVSEPDMNSPYEAHIYLSGIKQVLQYLNVSDCNMEEGSLRCDANISLRPNGEKKLGVRSELKNMNSFKAIEKALTFEIERQKKILKKGKKVLQDTRLWDDKNGCTYTMRSKEEAHDYRYFPEPDLVPMMIPKAWIDEIKDNLPELPACRKKRFIRDYKISLYDAQVLTADKILADYFEDAVRYGGSPKLIGNWIMTELLRELKLQGVTVENWPVSGKNLSRLVQLIEQGIITGKIAKSVFSKMCKDRLDPDTVIKRDGLTQINNEKELISVIDKVIGDDSKSVNDYKAGKQAALMYLVGQVMKITKGKANPTMAQKLLKERL